MNMANLIPCDYAEFLMNVIAWATCGCQLNRSWKWQTGMKSCTNDMYACFCVIIHNTKNEEFLMFIFIFCANVIMENLIWCRSAGRSSLWSAEFACGGASKTCAHVTWINAVSIQRFWTSWHPCVKVDWLNVVQKCHIECSHFYYRALGKIDGYRK